MTLSINKLSHQSGEKIYYNAEMRRHFEIYMGWLRNHEGNEERPVDPHTLYKYEGDFYGLLKTMGISPELHWLVMRVNDFVNPMDVPMDIKAIVIPNLQAVGRIVQRYRSQTKK